MQDNPNSSTDTAINLGILENIIGYQLRRAQTALFQNFSKKDYLKSITPGQFGLLVKISNNPGISQTALAKADGIERSTLGEIIDRFEERDLVERRKHAVDRRAYALHLTENGVRFLDEVIPLVLQNDADMTENFSDDEKEQLLRLLKMLASNG